MLILRVCCFREKDQIAQERYGKVRACNLRVVRSSWITPTSHNRPHTLVVLLCCLQPFAELTTNEQKGESPGAFAVHYQPTHATPHMLPHTG